MAVHQHTEQNARDRGVTRPAAAGAARVGSESGVGVAARCAFAGTRVLLGFVFLWAFFDKAFGWGYATPSAKSWVNGGSPTKGFLSGVAAGPMQSVFHSWAGSGLVDWLFMLGMLGLGVGLVSGVALRLTAVGGTAMMAFMWLAEWPPARHLANGSPSSSSNPLVDYHVMFAAIMIALAATTLGTAFSLGGRWARLPVVNRNPWLR
ncbi:hypothetical protein [Streptacidiphilus sp. PAMC 29251]